MAKYAVIRANGKQYKVQEGQEILIDKIVDLGTFEPEALLVVDGAKVEIGKPVLKTKVGVKVITEVEKGEKIEIYKFKAKSRYRKHIGFRPQYTRLLIESISK